MKKGLLISALLLLYNGYSQDSIVNYLDGSSHKIKNKDKALYIQSLVKKNNVWEIKKYNRIGKILSSGSFDNILKDSPSGTHKTFFRNGVLTSQVHYNDKGNIDGLYKRWFYNGKLDYYGHYKDGKKVGIWKYYHMNGKIGCRIYYQDGKPIKTLLYDEDGLKIEEELIEFRKPQFKGGNKLFGKRISKIHNFVGFQVNGRLYLDFVIDNNGLITDITSLSKIPRELLLKIKTFLKNTKGWSPAISMNRKIPYFYYFPLEFRVIFD